MSTCPRVGPLCKPVPLGIRNHNGIGEIRETVIPRRVLFNRNKKHKVIPNYYKRDFFGTQNQNNSESKYLGTREPNVNGGRSMRLGILKVLVECAVSVVSVEHE
jgi:hypothetical protein